MSQSFSHYVAASFLAMALGLFCACSNQGMQTISPVGATYSCGVGQACVTSAGYGAGYVHYSGNLASINNGIARSIISTSYGVSNWCLGGCYNTSTIDIIVSNGSAQVTINLGGYIISGQGTVLPIGNGSDVQVYPFSGGNRIDVVSSNVSITGSVGAIAAVPVQYGGQQFATASLMIEPY